MAQQTEGAPSAKTAVPVRVAAPEIPLAPVLKPAVTPAGTGFTPKTLQGTSDWKNPREQEQLNKAVAGRITDRPVGPDLKSADGVIRIDFGIAKQGDQVTTFFPFNIVTLEREETLHTPVIRRSEYIRYSNLNNNSGIRDVKLANGTKYHRSGAGAIMSGNGFDLSYQASKMGPVEETVIVYTTQGNIIYQLTGYVVGKDTQVTVAASK